MIGLKDSVMPLFGPRYWRHYVKLMLLVSLQAISSGGRVEPERDLMRWEGQQSDDEDEKARGAPRTDGQKDRLLKERANLRLLDPFLRTGTSLDCSYEVYWG
jgi:hypothetical protein